MDDKKPIENRYNAAKNYIPKAELVDGAYYKGQCRNANVARWNAAKNKFYHWRTKFRCKYVETIFCPEDDQTFDVFYAKGVAKAGEYEEIPVKEKI